MTEKKEGRTMELSLEIDAPIEAVWKALTDAKELVRWFPLEAEVEPRVGGRWLAGGETFAGLVLDCQPPRQFAGTVDALGDGIFRVEVFAGRPHLWLAVWDRGPEALARFEAGWRRALDRVLTATGS